MDNKKRGHLKQIYAILNAEFKRRYMELTDKGQSTKNLKTTSIKLWLLAHELGAKLNPDAEKMFVDFVYYTLEKRGQSIKKVKIYRNDITDDEMVLLRFIKFHNYFLCQDSIKHNKTLPKLDKSYEAYRKHMTARGIPVGSVEAIKHLRKRAIKKLDM